MKTVKILEEFRTEVNRSKFIAFIMPISDEKGFQTKLKKQHPKANHVVYAYRYLNEFEQIVENSSDDGEPKGCAGMPILNVLRGEQLINCAVFVVRYFGGIKLGTGGMARAYALSLKNLLKETTLICYEKEENYIFLSHYNQVDKILYQLKKLGLDKYEREFGMKSVSWSVYGTQEKLSLLKKTL